MIKKRNIKLNKRVITISLVIIYTLLFVGVLVGSLLAKYRAMNQEKAEIISANFHVSSNYLKEDGASYTVTDWAYHDEYDIIFELYNYEKDNVALITQDPIAYKINVDTGWTFTVKDEGGDVLPVDSVYVFPAGGRCAHTVMLKRVGAASSSTQVTVTTTVPYATTLSANFTLAESNMVVSKTADCGNYVSVTIETNNYAGNLNVTWTDAFSPDNTNPYMKSWSNATKRGTLAVNEHTIYELIFLKNTAANYNYEITVTAGGGE